MGQFGIGQAVRRSEDARLLTGAGRFTDDILMQGQAHAVVLRSPYAHARIRALELGGARTAPGVLAIYTAREVREAGLGEIRCQIDLPTRAGTPYVRPTRPLLAAEVVRHVGDPVAFVVAESEAAAQAAAERIEVDYDPLPAAVETAQAASGEAPAVWEEAPDNVSFVWETGDAEATARAIESAARVVRLRLVNNRVVVNAMEPRVALGAWDGERYTLYTPSQGSHSIRAQLAADIFGLPKERFRVVTPDVGGGFGMKTFLYPEQALVLLAAKALGRPVKWTGERTADDFLSDTQGRDQLNDAELALDEEGRFLALRVRTRANMGAYLSNFAPFIPTGACARMLSGAYRIPVLYNEVTGVFTHTVPVDAYRGAGRPEAIYVVERLVDAAARELGMDSIELRRRNFVSPREMPFHTATGLVYDSGDFSATLDMALARADRAGFAARREQARRAGRLLGLGVGYYVEACGGAVSESAEVRVDGEGRVTVLIGSQSNGQGHETAYAQIVADRLGVAIERVEVVQGDTDRIATGSGTGGSRALPVGGPACERGAQAVIDKGRRIAAELFEAAAADVQFVDGVFEVAGTDRRLDLAAVAAAALDERRLPPGEAPGLNGASRFEPEALTFPNGCHVCELEIDPDTGGAAIRRYTIVDDFGTVVNPLLLAGQVHGGVAQGVGQALLERCCYEPGDGQLLSGSFMDYCMPRADDLPDIDLSLNEGMPCLTNPLGIKGAGEAGAIGAPPAVINAVIDALAERGVTHIDMPATPERVWQALRQAQPGA